MAAAVVSKMAGKAAGSFKFIIATPKKSHKYPKDYQCVKCEQPVFR
jgi:hypothetical protein